MSEAKETVEQARDVALAILKPSAADIEHGTELHANSMVIESYGLGLRAAPDGAAVKALVERGASEAEIQEMMAEMGMTRYATDAREREEYLAAWAASGVTCTFQNAGEEGSSPLRLMKRLARHTYVTDLLRDFVSRAAFPNDIAATKERGGHCLYMTCNGVPLAQEWISVEEELSYIPVFFQLGCRMMHLTYNRRNPIGDGCGEPADAGLSDFGHAAVAEMNRVGVIVDVAHSGSRTSLDAVSASERPVVASHSVCAGLNQHVRAKSDELMKKIADTGGTMGITNVPAFLGGSGDISAMLDHIDYAVGTIGSDHITIGTDRPYVSSRWKEENSKIPRRAGSRPRWEALWPPGDPLFSPEWRQERQQLSMAWTNWPVFTIGLVQRGYSDKDIQKIIGGNILRVAREVLSLEPGNSAPAGASPGGARQ